MKENILENEGYVLIGSAKEIQARLGRPLETDVIALFRDSGDDEQATVLTELVRHVTIDFERKLHQRKRQAMSRVIDSYVEFVSLDKTALLEAEMEGRARKAALESTSWLTAREIGQMAGLTSDNPSAQTSKWKRQHRIFAIHHRNVDLFPAYALDKTNGYRPLKGLKPILELFGNSKDGWGLAYWFSSVNSYLGGQRPQDVLGTDPERVLAAADQERVGVEHG